MMFKVGDIVKFKDGAAGGNWVSVWHSKPFFVVEPVGRIYHSIYEVPSINIEDEDRHQWSMDMRSYSQYLEYAIILPNMEKVAVSLP